MSYEVFAPNTDNAVSLPYPFPGTSSEEWFLSQGLTQIGAATRPVRCSIPRWAITTDRAVVTTGQQFLVAISLYAGDVVTNVFVPIGATAGATLTHSTASFYTTNPANTTLTKVVDSADITTAAWAANTGRDFVLSAAQTITASGTYYIGVSVAGTTIPTFVGAVPVLAAGAGTGWSISGAQQATLCTVGGSAITTSNPASVTMSGYTVQGASTGVVPYVVCH